MVSLIRLQSDLFKWLEHLCSQGIDFPIKDSLWRGGRIDAVRFDGNYDVTVDF